MFTDSKEKTIKQAVTLIRQSAGNRNAIDEGIRVLELASARGSALAAFNLGTLYEQPNPYVENDQAKAIHWYRVAADRKDAKACVNLALLYIDGDDASHEEAFCYFEMAATMGNEWGQLYVAEMYYEGIGTTKDDELALYWFETVWRKQGFVCRMLDYLLHHIQNFYKWLSAQKKSVKNRRMSV